MELWWNCPKCGEKVSFSNEMAEVFDYDDGSADFDPKKGIYFHTIMCDCGAYWVMSLGEMCDTNDNNDESTPKKFLIENILEDTKGLHFSLNDPTLENWQKHCCSYCQKPSFATFTIPKEEYNEVVIKVCEDCYETYKSMKNGD